ncbi:membrane protein [Desulfocarbo indianensis]|nr:membrane protein [Desulfocarbo indianensis]
MAKGKTPATPALRALKAAKADFSLRPYAYEDHGGTARAAGELGVEEHAVVKTLVMQDEGGHPFLVLMHGDKEVSTKALARELGVKAVSPCGPADAERYTGYQVGGISPFGTKRQLPVYYEKSIMDLQRIYINAGRRGLLAELDPQELRRMLAAKEVCAAR